MKFLNVIVVNCQLNYGYCGICSCEKGSPGGGAGGLDIVLLEDEARPGQGLYMRHHHLTINTTSM
jgi:hypothetical protein